MSIFDIFKSGDTTAQVAVPNTVTAPGPAQPGNLPANVDPNAAPAQPAPAATPAVVETKDESPLAEFNTLWEDKPVDPNAPKPTEPKQLTAEDLQKVIGKADFSTGINPETMTAIAAGGNDAQKAFAAAMNTVAQQVMIQATLVNNKLTEKAVTEAVAATEAKMPDLLRSLSASDHLKTTNPLFSNPAVKPVIEATQAQLQQKFPNATAAELTEMTQNYIVAMGNAFAPPSAMNDNDHQETDWSKFLGG